MRWPTDVLFAELQLTSSRTGPSDSFGVFFAGRILTEVLAEAFPAPGSSVRVVPIKLAQYAGQEGDFTIVFSSPTPGNTIALSNLMISYGTAPAASQAAGVVRAALEGGSVTVAPNVMNLSIPSDGVTVFAKGSSNGSPQVRIFDEAGDLVASMAMDLDATGFGSVRIDPAAIGGKLLASGTYWVVVAGGGVSGRKPFVVVRGI